MFFYMKYNHHIIDIKFDDVSFLTDMAKCEDVLITGCIENNITVINKFFHEFENTKGYTGVICLAESHISIHTWPENMSLCLDIFICDNDKSNNFVKYIEKNINFKEYDHRIIKRT